ncbi:(2Fe-2S)-binding protein [Streptomyces sp. NPDC058572]|uniref:(2Fe-2S)-binding protein n=1 Tax=Streptomyces sp. NPDC058572 TaxID=3346546 RepID=UPI00365477E6
MSNDDNTREVPEGFSDGFQYETGGWQPTPQGGEYDSEATAFLQLPPDGAFDAAPLEAPGHGYVPPMIMPLTPAAGTDPGTTGNWTTQWPEPEAGDPQATGQWNFPEERAPEHAAADATGQWSFPSAEADVAAPAAEQDHRYGTPGPAAGPGGAPASWTTLPGGATAPWAQQEQPEPAAAAEEPAGSPDAPAGSPDAAPSAADAGHAPVPDAADSASAEPAAEAAPVAPVTSSAGSDEHPSTSYVLRVNGTDRPVSDAWIGESLLYVLRERLGLAGAKDGCSQGECGACNVQVDGRLVASCLVPAATAAGSEVRTVEGLATDGEPSDVQRALAVCGAVQCGFCIPGMAMTVHDLLEGNHAPTELETRQALCGNLCRCSGYRGVLDAVRDVVAERAAAAAAAAEPAEEARIPHQAPPGAGSVRPHPHDGGMA